VPTLPTSQCSAACFIYIPIDGDSNTSGTLHAERADTMQNPSVSNERETRKL
jgi:hypothetical protein